MQTKRFILMVTVISFFTGSPAIAQGTSLQELHQRCEQAREEKIAPLREQAIEECITNNPRRRNVEEYCERFYSDFGQGGRTQSGHFRQPMFNDLLECVEFREAEAQNREQSRSR